MSDNIYRQEDITLRDGLEELAKILDEAKG